ncbi:cell wall-binding repeat-containing protein [Virgibacillus flavescens]|uniref:cell wall-binding repeat-containing protein n=1 Tax=Virgibacillus flavescens TaxID=1611422 RepID=UPI003D351EFD
MEKLLDSLVRSKQVALMILLVMVVNLVSTPLVVLADGDGEPPVVESLEVSPNEVSVGDTVTVKADVRDSNSGVDTVGVFFDSPSGNNEEGFFLDYNATSGLWEGKYIVTETDEAGKWVFNFISVEDKAGNRKFYYPQQLQSTNTLDFLVINPTGDGEPPVVESLEVSPNEVSVGDTVTVKADVRDSNSGVDTVGVFFDSPSGNSEEGFFLDYNATSGLWEGKYIVTEIDEAGKWVFNFISVEDKAGNRKFYYPQQLQSTNTLDFLVINPTGDGEPPVVESLEVSPKEVEVGDRVIVKADVRDSDTGVDTVGVFFDSPSGNSEEGFFLNYNATSGLWEGKYIVTETDEAGQWVFDFISVEDKAGNSEFYYPGELLFSNNFNFTVIPPSDLGLEPLPHSYTTYDETWTQKTIDGDLYVGPESQLTINGDVTITGDVYVFGTIRNYGDLTINGTLNARRVYYGSYSNSPGTVMHLGGSNRIPSTSVSNQAWDVPLEIYNEDLTVQDGKIILEGATVPVTELYVEDQKVDVSYYGTFRVPLENVTADKVTFTMKDVFGYSTTKEVSVIDTMAPAKVAGLKVDNTSASTINISWDKNNESDLDGYNIYLDGENVDSISSSDNEYKFTELKAASSYEMAVEAFDRSSNKSVQTVITAETKLTTPVVNDVSDKDEMVTGTADPSVDVKVSDGEKLIASDLSEADGSFEVHIPKQIAGKVLFVQSFNQDGNKSDKVQLTVEDVTEPSSPSVDEITDNSKIVSGEAEAGTSITVTGQDGTLGTADVSNDGSFEVNISEQTAGQKIEVIATDAAGNVSEPTVVIVSDATAPAKPEIEEVTDQSTEVTGSAEAGATITVSILEKEIGTTEADVDGKFALTISKRKAGEELSVTATDAAGNISEPTIVKVKDITAPTWPEAAKLTVSDVGEKELTLHWTEASDNAGVSQYRIYQDSKLIETVDGSKTNVTITNLLPGHTYQFKIEAGDELNNWTTGPSSKAKTVGQSIERIAGDSRFSTATEISNSGWDSAETVLLARGYDFPDALAGTPLAYQLDAPILLTRKGELLEETKSELKRLGTSKVIILGGPGAISAKVEDSLRGLGMTTERIAGDNRFETAAKIAERMGGAPKKAVVTDGFNYPDALAIASYAASQGYPILLSKPDTLPVVTKKALEGKEETYVIGGPAAISNEVAAEIPAANRISGINRFDTAVNIIKELNLSTDKVYVATGYSFADALTGSILAAKNNAPLLLVRKDRLPLEIAEIIEQKQISDFTILGGESAVNDGVLE